MTMRLIHDLMPAAEQLMDRHIGSSKEWFPHELVPWDRVADGDPRDPWSEDLAPMPDGIRSALLVNLLTEDNLPYYFRTIERMFGADEVWGR